MNHLKIAFFVIHILHFTMFYILTNKINKLKYSVDHK